MIFFLIERDNLRFDIFIFLIRVIFLEEIGFWKEGKVGIRRLVWLLEMVLKFGV